MTAPPLDHVLAMTDDVGMFEHADHTLPRVEHGYCTDDVARLLIVAVRSPERSDVVLDLARLAYRFVVSSQSPSGRTRNRRSAGGVWTDRPSVDDCWGRSLWALGTTAHRAPDGRMRSGALIHFDRGAQQRSPYRRAMAFAALGAAEVVAIDPGHRRARALLADAVTTIGPVPKSGDWTWPEPRLSYANAAVAEALLAAGQLLGDDDVIDRGLTMLRWLLSRETVDGHLSPTPVGGAGRRDKSPGFDQQPIEVAAMADACVRAAAVTDDVSWLRGAEMAIAWFEGANDGGAIMWDNVTGGGYDGLTPRGPNLNQGAESTLAVLATMQLAVSVRQSVS